jgi:hypothetical protein
VSIQSKWAYLARTTGNISRLLQPIEYVLRHKLIPAITGKTAINDAERRMFALPVRHGGLGIEILTEVADHKFSNSRKVTQPLRNSIRSREGMDEAEIDAEMNRLAREVKNENKGRHRQKVEDLHKEVNMNDRKALLLAEQKGSSSWLTTLPIEENGFALHKGAFRDALALRYGWRPTGMPTVCACGKANGVEHALSCCKGGNVIR